MSGFIFRQRSLRSIGFVVGLAISVGCAAEGVTSAGGMAGLGSGGAAGSVTAGAGGSVTSGGSTSTSGSSGSGGLDLMNPMDGGADMGPTIITELPDGFTAADVGGLQLGAALAPASSEGNGSGGPVDPTCSNILAGVVRDFRGKDEPNGHPDFQAYAGDDPTRGLVLRALGGDAKPMYGSRCEAPMSMPTPICPYLAQMTSASAFAQWYHETPNVNLPYIVRFWFAPQKNGLFSFRSRRFFPIDGGGFPDSPRLLDDDGNPHNFSFTTELHIRFKYVAGQTFSFEGDDDVWVFINGHLAVDLGGLHQPVGANVDLDASAQDLELTVGKEYPLDFFHAERHDHQSNFRIDTNLAFTGCGDLPGDVKVF